MQTFYDWLRDRSNEAPAAERLATLIARSAGGISRRRLAAALGLPSETLNDLLKALTATGQVRMLRVNGELVYRAAG
jgi:hypothetical protein